MKDFNVTIGFGLLTAVTVIAPMFGVAGIAIALVTSCILTTAAFHFIFQNAGRPRVHHHFYHGPQGTQQPRPYTEGHERKALLPNGTQLQERIVRRYDQ